MKQRHRGDIGSPADDFIEEITNWLTDNLVTGDNIKLDIKIGRKKLKIEKKI